MKVYVAAKYFRRGELMGFAHKLAEAGHECTSRWITEDGEHGKKAADAAQMDLDDVDRADALVFFGQARGSENRGGGRWFEFGRAHAQGKPCVAVLDMATGTEHDINEVGHESVFTHLPEMLCVVSEEGAILALGILESERRTAA